MWPDLQEGVLYAHHFNTQISPPFYRYIIRQSMGACIVANSSPVCFSGCFWGMSDVHECSVCIQLSLLAVKQRPPSCKVRLTRPCSDIIYWFNYFLGQFRHQWIHNTSVNTQGVLSPPLRGSPPPPTNPHPYICNHLWYWWKKLSKMAGNSASKPSKRTPTELPCISIDWWRIS